MCAPFIYTYYIPYKATVNVQITHSVDVTYLQPVVSAIPLIGSTQNTAKFVRTATTFKGTQRAKVISIANT